MKGKPAKRPRILEPRFKKIAFRQANEWLNQEQPRLCALITRKNGPRMTTQDPLSPLPIDQWDPQLAHIVEDMKGAPINVHKLMAHSPSLLQAWWDFRNFSVNGGTLGQHLGELVILRVGVHLGAWYEWGSHVDRAMRLGMPIAAINAVLLHEIGPDWPEVDGLVLRAVDELMTTHAIHKSTRAALAPHLSTPQLMDLIAIHGMYVTLGCMIHTWGLELDEAVAARLAGLTDSATFEAAAQQFKQDVAAAGSV
jgi:4-carboxymuconolactone decarboxylase